MARFRCAGCAHEGHFTEFCVGRRVEEDTQTGELVEEDDLQCPSCREVEVYEL